MDNSAQNQVVTWARNHIPERVYVIAVLIAVGLVTGVGAFVLKWLVRTINHLLTRHLLPALPDYSLILIPVAGLLITVAFMRYVIHQNISHGSDLVKRRLIEGRFDLRPSMIISPIIASSITLGFGGSAGAEGPIATTGAAIGSNFARWAGLSPQQLRVIICCGAGAGIAAIFKAPVGGMFYTIEVLALPLTTANFVALAITCITSGLTAYALSGYTPDLSFAGAIEPSQYGYVVLVGLFCGLYSAYYSSIVSVLGRWYTSIKSRWSRAVIAGLITGGLILIFPAMYGEGYEVMRAIINGHPDSVLNGSLMFSMTSAPVILLLVTAGVMMVKAVGTASATNGGVAGDFSPALFAGCMAGYVFIAGLNLIFGMTLPVGAFVITGMAASMSGIIKAPLMAIFITTEMTGNFSMFLPIVIASAISYAVVAAIAALRKASH
ncbi:MAG: chloride channel protein [Duncaniella sp.]|nr:chloride channel protein [Duncaniella sp.]